MTAPSVARPRRPAPAARGLGAGGARAGATSSSRHGSSGSSLFTLVPMIATLVFTFTNINLAQEEPLAVRRAATTTQTLLADQQTWDSLGVTFRFALLALPVAVVLPFLVALMLHSRHLRGAGAFRVLFFLPYVDPVRRRRPHLGGMLNLETAGSTTSCASIGIEHPPDWLQDPTWIYPGLVIMGIWGIGAGMIVNLAGLKGIPTELYDAARIDGAGAWASLRHITLPMMSPVIFYTLVLGVVEVLQYFLVPLVLNNGTGEPGGTTLLLQPLPVQELLHLPEHVLRGDAGLAAVRDHAR